MHIHKQMQSVMKSVCFKVNTAHTCTLHTCTYSHAHMHVCTHTCTHTARNPFLEGTTNTLGIGKTVMMMKMKTRARSFRRLSLGDKDIPSSHVF